MGVSAQSIFSALCAVAPSHTLNITIEKTDVSGILCTNAHLMDKNSFSQTDYAFAKAVCDTFLNGGTYNQSLFCAINNLLSAIKPDFIMSSSIYNGEGIENGKCIPSPKVIDLITRFKIPYETLKIQKNLATEDGIAVIKKITNDFGLIPKILIDKIGYGTDGERIVKAVTGFDEQKSICDLFEASQEISYDENFLYSTKSR